jgi:RNA polymerase sigma factor (sigma-70 family)
MDKPLVEIIYQLANGKRIRIEVSVEVKSLLEQTDRQIRSQRRQDRRYLDFVESMDELDTLPMQSQEDIADLINRMDSYKWLYTAINELPESQRRRLCLYYLQGLTYRQIAEMEGVGFKTVSRSITRALDTLKKLYTE